MICQFLVGAAPRRARRDGNHCFAASLLRWGIASFIIGVAIHHNVINLSQSAHNIKTLCI